MKNIDNRRSIRQFTDKPIDDAMVEKLMRAAMQAPSAGNQQPWEFIVIREKSRLAELAGMSIYAGPVAKAPMAVVVLGNIERMRFPEHWEQDLAAATQNMLLEAVELGLGAVWLGVSPTKERMNFLSDYFGLEESLLPFGVVVIGHPTKPEANHFVDRYEESRVHFEQY